MKSSFVRSSFNCSNCEPVDDKVVRQRQKLSLRVVDDITVIELMDGHGASFLVLSCCHIYIFTGRYIALA